MSYMAYAVHVIDSCNHERSETISGFATRERANEVAARINDLGGPNRWARVVPDIATELRQRVGDNEQRRELGALPRPALAGRGLG